MDSQEKQKRSIKFRLLFHVVLPAIWLTIVIGVILQVTYPYDRTLPYAKVGKVDIGMHSRTEAAQLLSHAYSNMPLEVTIDKQTSVIATSAQAGIVPVYADAIDKASDYPLWQRLIPFSILYKTLRYNTSISYNVENELFEQFAKKVAEKCQIAAKDAGIEYADGRVQLREASNGRACVAGDLKEALQVVDIRQGSVAIDAPTTSVPPVLQDQAIAPLVTEAQAIVAQGLTIANPESQTPIPAEQLARWLVVAKTDSGVVLQPDTAAIRSYLESLRDGLYVAPGVTMIKTRNGKIVSQEVGGLGRGVDVEVSTQRVSDVMFGKVAGTRTAWVQFTYLPAKVAYDRQYDATAAGLQAMIAQWASEQSGRWGVVARDLAGKGMDADYRAGDDFVTASTFKIYLAYAVLHKVETGQMSLAAATDQGLSVGGCIEEMIVRSTNACATSLFNMAGWNYVHDLIRGQFPNTSMANSASKDNEKHTTPADTASFLTLLQKGQLINAEHTDVLLGYMKRQIYRDGIPAGSAGSVVADKIGFYLSYKHDAGIVYSPRGTYVLSVYSSGGNWSQIADLSRRVSALLAQN